MSDDLPTDRAGLYVLGVLDAAEMQEVRRDAVRDSALSAAIEAWERRLTPLTALAGETTPPSELWDAVTASLDGALPGAAAPQPRRQPGGRDARRGPGARAVAAWRATALGAMAVAAGLAGLLVWRIEAPVQPAAPRLTPRFAMILPLQQTPGGWLVEVQPDGRIRAVAQGNVSHAADRDFELWALADHATRPVPLGLLPVGAGSADLPPGNLPKQNFKLLVSLEPKGGSPTGLPTGPVMFGGDVNRPPG
jgi:anti-sigma-K factor RskA